MPTATPHDPRGRSNAPAAYAGCCTRAATPSLPSRSRWSAFIVVLIDLGLGLGLLIFIGGILLISVASWWRAASRGSNGSGCAGCSVARRHAAYLCAPSGSGFWRRSLTPLKDAQSWLDVCGRWSDWSPARSPSR